MPRIPGGAVRKLVFAFLPVLTVVVIAGAAFADDPQDHIQNAKQLLNQAQAELDAAIAMPQPTVTETVTETVTQTITATDPPPTTSPPPTTTAPPTTTVPPAATGCPEGWYAAEAQSWWQDAPGPFNDMAAGHLHLGGCIPLRTTHLTGTVPFDLVVKMHNNDGNVTYVAIVTKTDTAEVTYLSVNPGWTCPSGDCTFIQHFDLPVSAFNLSGRQEIRFRATALRPNGNEFRASLNFEAVIDNGEALTDFDRMPYARGKGWYTGTNYCEAAYRDDITPIPTAPVSGWWTPYITQLDHGSTDADPTYWSIRVDPDIHHGDMGLFLGEGVGSRDGFFPIDTTQLANGPHKLFLQTKCEVAAGQNVGVLVIPFTVEN